MARDKRPHLVYALVLVVGTLFLYFSPGCKDKPSSDGSLMPGRCGLEGMMVECNDEIDCVNNPYGRYACSDYGVCFHYYPGQWSCLNPGVPCDLPLDSICNIRNECSYPCETHEDCPDGMCECDRGLSLCARFYCFDDKCLDFTHPVMGTRICAPNEDFLEGECINWGGECDEGYEKVGERGCIKIPEE